MAEYLKGWAQKLLNIFRRREADPNIGRPCPDCDEQRALYRCIECDQRPVFCVECLVKAHKHNSLHRVERWSGTHFERTTLSELGLVVHLEHRGQCCPYVSRSAKPVPLTVVHTNGIHTVRVQYCRCPNVDAEPLQLWQAGWWPGTFKRTRTVFTYHALKVYDRLTLQAKTSAQDFIATLRRLTNHAFPKEVKVSATYSLQCGKLT